MNTKIIKVENRYIDYLKDKHDATLSELKIEVEKLKKESSEETIKKRRQQKLEKLEKERDKLRFMAERLDKLVKVGESESIALKNKCEILEEERSFLEDQIYNSKKQNEILTEESLKNKTDEGEKLLNLKESISNKQLLYENISKNNNDHTEEFDKIM
jgi:hypothetical protein